jgi:hypothetical protein
MNSSMLRFFRLFLALCIVNSANAFVVQVAQPKINKGLKAGGAVNAGGAVDTGGGIVKNVLKKFGFLGKDKTEANFPLYGKKYKKMREIQPKPREEEESLQSKYDSIDDVGERAFQILVDLGLVEETKSENKKL